MKIQSSEYIIKAKPWTPQKSKAVTFGENMIHKKEKKGVVGMILIRYPSIIRRAL